MANERDEPRQRLVAVVERLADDDDLGRRCAHGQQRAVVPSTPVDLALGLDVVAGRGRAPAPRA